MVAGDLRRRMERIETDAPRPMPAVERETKKTTIGTKLHPATEVIGVHDPPDCLHNGYAAMVEANLADWDPFEHCPSASKVVGAAQPKKRWLHDARGTVCSSGANDFGTRRT